MPAIKDFIEMVTNENVNYGLSIKWFAQKIEAVHDLDTVMEMTLDEICELLIAVHPTNARSISSYLNMLRRYAEYSGNQYFINISACFIIRFFPKLVDRVYKKIKTTSVFCVKIEVSQKSITQRRLPMYLHFNAFFMRCK